MTEAPSIDFVIAGGHESGLGHVMRSAALASAAARRGWQVRAFIHGDPTVVTLWQTASAEKSAFAWSEWTRHTAARYTLFDFSGEKLRWLTKARPSNTKMIVLDDARYLDEADLTICPTLYHYPIDARQQPFKPVLQGPHFAILSEIHRAMPPQPVGARSKLLLSLGGADPHRVTPRIAPVLASVLADGDVPHDIRSWHVVLGAAFSDPLGLVARRLARIGWQVHLALDPIRMARLMSETRLAVMGFGTSLTELAWHQTPHVSVTHHQSDVQPAKFLEAQGIGMHLGCAESLADDVVEARFRRALEDAQWQRESVEIAHRALHGGHGVERILKEIEVLFSDHPAPASLLSTTKNSGGLHVPSA